MEAKARSHLPTPLAACVQALEILQSLHCWALQEWAGRKASSFQAGKHKLKPLWVTQRTMGRFQIPQAPFHGFPRWH